MKMCSFFVLPLAFSLWGFTAHQYIARQVLQELPTEYLWMADQFQHQFETSALAPDMRRHSDPHEPCRHYTDMEHFMGQLDSLQLPDSSQFEYGCAIPNLRSRIRKMAWLIEKQDSLGMVKCLGEICHYAADMCVPLHATHNYDGQLSGFDGIHGFWETRLFERFRPQPGSVPTIEKVTIPLLWQISLESYRLSKQVIQDYDSCLKAVKSPWGIYYRNGVPRKGESVRFCNCYFQKEGEMIQRRLEKSIALTIASLKTALFLVEHRKNKMALKDD